MLFRTVHGPELALVCQYLALQERSVSREELRAQFLRIPHKGERASSLQHIDDALSFLDSAYLVQVGNDQQIRLAVEMDRPFSLLVLYQLRRLCKRELPSKHPLDPLYWHLLEACFILPGRLYVPDLHRRVNQEQQIIEQGGLSKEKVRAWQRVMTFLGVGQRVQGGFQCVYRPDLIKDILANWRDGRGYLQDFLENHMAIYLPFETAKGELSASLTSTMAFLAVNGDIELSMRHDSPAKAYGGDRRWRFLATKQEFIPHA